MDGVARAERVPVDMQYFGPDSRPPAEVCRDRVLEYTGAALDSGAAPEPAATVALRARRASILLHSGRVDAATAELASAEEVYETLDTVNDALANLVYFVRSIVAVTRRSPDAERILNEAIAFEERRGVTWARLGFQGWLAIHLINVDRLDEAERLLVQSLGRVPSCRRSAD